MRRIPKPIAIAGYAAAVVLMAAGGVMFAQSAGAVIIDDDHDGVFTLDASPYPFSETEFSPGSSADLLITAQLGGGQGDAAFTLQLSYSGVLATDPDGLDLLLQECSVPFSGSPLSCSGTATDLHNGTFASASTALRDLGTIQEGGERYFLARFSLPADAPDTMQGQEANFTFTFTAQNDSENVTNLPRTGVPDLIGPILLGAGLVLGGLILARQRAGAAAELARTEGSRR